MKFLPFFLYLLAAITGCPRQDPGKVENLVLPAGEGYYFPRFDSSGEKLLVTSDNYRGLKVYDFGSGQLLTISDAEGAGYSPLFSAGGESVVFVENEYRDNLRYSRLVTYSFPEGRERELQPFSRKVPMTVMAGIEVLLVDGGMLKSADPGGSSAMAERAEAVVIEDQKLVLYRFGEHRVLDPFNGGSYIWPSLSPDGKRIVAYAMGRGTFVCDSEGEVLFEAADLEAPVWAGNSWLAGMVTTDDGHRITASEVVLVETASGEKHRISPKETIALYPAVSIPAELIAWHTPAGEIQICKTGQLNFE